MVNANHSESCGVCHQEYCTCQLSGSFTFEDCKIVGDYSIQPNHIWQVWHKELGIDLTIDTVTGDIKLITPKLSINYTSGSLEVTKVRSNETHTDF